MNETYLMWGIVGFCAIMFLLIMYKLLKREKEEEPQQRAGQLFNIKKQSNGSWEGKNGNLCFSGDSPDSVISKINQNLGIRK